MPRHDPSASASATLTADPPISGGVSVGLRRLSPAAYLAVSALAACLGWLTLANLPADPYVRFQWLRDTDYIKGRWIYERLHFDPTPVDVAFLGTSHTLTGVNDAGVERALGTEWREGVHVVNLALPHYGRDVDYLLGRLLLQEKRPSLLILETDLIEFRVNHPAFPLIADARDLAEAPLVINTGLFDGLAWIPKRRLEIFLSSLPWIGPLLYPDAPVRTTFDPAAYGGPHRDDTYQPEMRNGYRGKPRTTHPDPEMLRADAALEVRGDLAKARQYKTTAGGIEIRYHELYLRRLLDLLKQNGTEVVFLYLPVFGAPEAPAHAAELVRYGPIWSLPREILDDPALWLDKSHLNHDGSAKLSAWLGRKIAEEGRPVGSGSVPQADQR